MPRNILINDKAQEVSGSLLSAAPPKAKKTMSPVEIDRALRQKRSPKYIETMHRMDAGTQVMDRNAFDEVIAAIQQELPEVMLQYPCLGVVARCYLGPPYEVHTLDFAGRIITHYETQRPLPPLLERARSLSLHKEYAFIEVYSDHLVAVRNDGSNNVVTC